MNIKSLKVKHFRSILDDQLDCDALTALVGSNGSGKSSFLRALELFYSTSPKFSAADFYDNDVTEDIEISITFTNLNTHASKLFADYLEGNDLTVVRVLTCREEKFVATYHGSRRQNPDFRPVRDAAKAADKKKAYETLQGGKYGDLPKWTKQETALDALREWEAGHLDLCARERDDGKFFGFNEVAEGYLGRYTRFILVPAVRDAEGDAADSKSSVISDLMDLVVRRALAERQDIVDLQAETKKKYTELLDPSKCGELARLQEDLTRTLVTYVPNAAVALSWADDLGIEMPLPKAMLRLEEDGFVATVQRTGHGLQRAFIFTMLQHLTMARAQEANAPQGAIEPQNQADTKFGPNLVFCIEEPELYQHPNRQRHLAKILLSLASGTIPGVAASTQVLYATHSPLFVGIDRLDQIRLVRKHKMTPGKPPASKNVSVSCDDVAKTLWEADGSGKPMFTGTTLRPRLHCIMTPWMNEGFFADVAVLVEGEDDRAAILGAATQRKIDLESLGAAIIPCGGKTNRIDLAG
jgi:hypothetical protein